MQFTFRWYGNDDLVTLAQIRQIPGVKGIVTAIYDVPVGETWPYEKIINLQDNIESHGLELSVIESVPVHEDIKLGLPTRDKYIANYITTLRNLAKAGIKVVCYNFMPVFDWTRSSLDFRLDDGSTALGYEEAQIAKMDPLTGELSLPGWDTSYNKQELKQIFAAYAKVDSEQLWKNLEYFIRAIMPAAEEAGIKMAIHPDDPPWPIFGLPRIITNQESLERLVQIYDSESNGLCICTGSLGADPANDLPRMISYFGGQQRINFVHARNIKITGRKSFHETAHLSAEGSIDMYGVMCALSECGYAGPIRPDHGRMVWGDRGRPGYGLYDRAMGAVYLQGIYEAVQKGPKKQKIENRDFPQRRGAEK